MSLKAGIAKVDITSPIGVYLTGFGNREKPSIEVKLPLKAKYLVLKDEKEKVFIVTNLRPYWTWQKGNSKEKWLKLKLLYWAPVQVFPSAIFSSFSGLVAKGNLFILVFCNSLIRDGRRDYILYKETSNIHLSLFLLPGIGNEVIQNLNCDQTLWVHMMRFFLTSRCFMFKS